MLSKLEDLVQRVEDVFLQVLALPAVDESSFFLIKDVWQQSVNDRLDLKLIGDAA